MSEEIELKPCPFCGAKVDFYEGDETLPDHIICHECGFYMDAEKFNVIKQGLDVIETMITDFVENICNLLHNTRDQLIEYLESNEKE